MASLYDAIRTPWASWPMTMQAHDPTGEPDGVQLLVDGDMEAAGTAAWAALSSTISKQPGTRTGGSGTQVLRIVSDGLDSNCRAAAVPAPLTVGARYRATGWARSSRDTGAAIPTPSVLNGATEIWQVTAPSVDWQYFDVSFVAVATSFLLRSRYSTDTNDYAEFDDVRIELIPPRVLDVSGNGRHLTLGNGFGANQPTKLTQKRGYRNDGTDYLKAVDLSWASSVITVEVVLSAYARDTSGVIIDIRDTSGAPFQARLVREAAEYRFFSGAIVANAAARYAIPSPQMGCASLIGRYNGASTDLFVDGVLTASALVASAPNTGITDINLFQAYNGASNYSGIDAYLCRIWDKALTDVQIRELARKAKQELTRI